MPSTHTASPVLPAESHAASGRHGKGWRKEGEGGREEERRENEGGREGGRVSRETEGGREGEEEREGTCIHLQSGL